jgi:sporulation protein YlmC with PRC-barrel domain
VKPKLNHALTLPLAAADPAEITQPTPKEYEQGRARQPERLGPVVKATDALGKDVKNLQDEKLGKVEEMVIDVESGQILEILLGSGGVLGVGDKLIALPPRVFTCEPPHPTIRLNISKDKLNGAPAFEMSKWAEITQPDRVAERYRYFGQEPAFLSMSRGVSPNAPSRGFTKAERATKVIGASVRNPSHEKLGKVENLMVDIEAGRLVHVVVGSGGVLGIGEELRAIPTMAFRYGERDGTLFLSLSKEAFTVAPHFKGNVWPDFNDVAYSAGIYRAYQLEPYFSVTDSDTRRNVREQKTDVDTTRQNTRDRDEKQLTPLDQGNSEADIAISRSIRKELMDDKSLSTTARNIKIITVNGYVTLRGPVENEAERSTIEAIAQRAAQKVDNQLEVKQQ